MPHTQGTTMWRIAYFVQRASTTCILPSAKVAWTVPLASTSRHWVVTMKQAAWCVQEILSHRCWVLAIAQTVWTATFMLHQMPVVTVKRIVFAMLGMLGSTVMSAEFVPKTTGVLAAIFRSRVPITHRQSKEARI